MVLRKHAVWEHSQHGAHITQCCFTQRGARRLVARLNRYLDPVSRARGINYTTARYEKRKETSPCR